MSPLGDMDSAWMIWSLVFGLIGFAAFTYGRKQHRGAPTLVGVALMVYPYFVSNIWLMVGIGVLLVAALVAGNRFEDTL